MDRIILSGVEVYAYGGVTEAERQIGQRYRIDIELDIDLRAAAASDALEDTASYAEVYEVATSIMRERPFKLIENVAARIAEGVLRQFPAERVCVRLSKLLPPIDGIVAAAAVEITRDRTGLTG